MVTGLYIHIPFCKQKCNYCDFASFAGREILINDYLNALEKEASLACSTSCQTLYVGGGTPSLLSVEQLQKLVQVIEKNFEEIPSFQESTLEANPESLSREKIAFLRQAGFNRLSLGLQSFNDTELKTLGRIHTVADFLQAWDTLQDEGIENVNVDLMAGLPGQTLTSFADGLEQVIRLKPNHLSVYGLQVEEGTPFFERGLLCDQLLMRQMLEHARARLTTAGYHHYEISNFARPGYESKHNMQYWQYADYVGLGSAAVSYLNGVRCQNTPDVQEYIRLVRTGNSPVVFNESLSGQALEGEKLMLGLRQLDGVTLTPLQQQFFGHEIEKHIQKGLLVQEDKKVKLSEEGIYLANEVFYSFVAPFEEI